MKLLIEYDSGYKIARATFYGMLDDDLLMQSYQEIGKVARVRRPEIAILDFSHLTVFGVSTGAISRLALAKPNIAEPYPRCVVAPEDIAYGMSRMFQALSEEKRKNFHVVRTMAEAYEVLGIVAEPDFSLFASFEVPDPPAVKTKHARPE
jgi:hypothetical protein